jgi:CRP/FNR family transcriptional regulator, cyclic AMP receptor protein
MMGEVSPSALAAHAFLRGLPPDLLARLAGIAAEVSVPAGHRFFEEGGPAERFWLIRTGHVALDMRLPGRPRLIVETLGDGDMIGISWVAPPQEWQYGAEAVRPTTAFELTAGPVIALCDSDPAFGYQLTRRLLAVAAGRLHASRVRLMDLYAAPGNHAGAS